jgi:hypothetical protein
MAGEESAGFAEARQEIAAAPEPETAIAMAEAAFDAEDAVEVAVEPATAESPVAVEQSLDTVEGGAIEPAAVAEITDAFSRDAAAQAEDEAVLEAIALEMAAPDPEFDEIVEPAEMEAAIPEPAAAEIAAPLAAELANPVAPEPATAAIAEEPVAEAPIAMDSLARLTEAIAEAAAEVMEQPAVAMAATPTLAAAPTAPLPMPSPLPEPSLGATILASGIVQKPRTAANDALAPIRRMTQAEKIAFFS